MRGVNTSVNGERHTRRLWSSGRLMLGALAVGALVMAGCGSDLPQSSLNPGSTNARTIDDLYRLVLIIATVIFVGVQTALIVAVVRFRKRKNRPERPVKQVHGNTPLEIAWTIAPALILVGIAIPTLRTIFDIAEQPDNALEVNVTGHQWWWEFEYTNLAGGTVVTANELHIPTDQPAYLTMSGADGDVIHSFWVPPLAGKRDVVPGNITHLTLTADEPGVYYGQCAEFCGWSHANMRLRVVAQDRADFDAWTADQLGPAAIPADDGSLRAEGWNLFLNRGCTACHAINGTEALGGGVNPGPNLTHLASRSTFAGATYDLTDENLSRWLANPEDLKPMQPDKNRGMPNLGLSDEEITALVAFLQGLK
jgi:cytochrome c oxidase subunit 2